MSDSKSAHQSHGPETLRLIGTQLREAREQKNLTLQQVAETTRIHANILQNLENGKIDSSPGPVFTRGFIRTYAKLVGLDNDILQKELNSIPELKKESTLHSSITDISARNEAESVQVGKYVFVTLLIAAIAGSLYAFNYFRTDYDKTVLVNTSDSAINTTVVASAPVNEPKKKEIDTSVQSATSLTKETITDAKIQPKESAAPEGAAQSAGNPATVVSPPAPSQTGQIPAPPAGMAAPVNSPSATGTTNSASPTTPQGNISTVKTTITTTGAGSTSLTAANEKKPENPPVSTTGVAATTAATASTMEGLHLVVKGIKSTWLDIAVDNEKVIEVQIQPGEELDWKAKEGYKLTIGNAKGVEMSLNGKPLTLDLQKDLISDWAISKADLTP